MQQRIPFNELKDSYERVLTNLGLSRNRAQLCARLFAENQRDGIYSHGLIRFPGLVRKIQSGQIDAAAEPQCLKQSGVVEQWDGRMGIGLLNAHASMGRAVALAQAHGMGCVGLRNTNHWMRAGAYVLQAAEKGCIGICWTNTTSLMPPWGAAQKRIGNNPIAIAIPRAEGHILLDMAMSQYSNGKLEVLRLQSAELPQAGGYDVDGNLTCDPGAILESQRALPIGYWKGSALAVVLDTLAALISGGQSTHEISAQSDEYAVSQVYIAIDVTSLVGQQLGEQVVSTIVDDLHETEPLKGESVRYPGEGMLGIRRKSMEDGVLVDSDQWEALLAMEEEM